MTTGFYVRVPGIDEDPVRWIAGSRPRIGESGSLELVDELGLTIRGYAAGEWCEVWAGEAPDRVVVAGDGEGDGEGDEEYEEASDPMLMTAPAIERLKTWRTDLGLD